MIRISSPEIGLVEVSGVEDYGIVTLNSKVGYLEYLCVLVRYCLRCPFTSQLSEFEDGITKFLNSSFRGSPQNKN